MFFDVPTIESAFNESGDSVWHTRCQSGRSNPMADRPSGWNNNRIRRPRQQTMTNALTQWNPSRELNLRKVLSRSVVPALAAAGLALSGAGSLQAEEQINPTTGTYGSGKIYKTTVERKTEGELSAEDLHQASLLSSQ